MLKALNGYSNSSDYFKRKFNVHFRQPNLEEMVLIKETLKAECSLDDLRMLKAGTSSNVEQIKVYNSSIVAFGIALSGIGLIFGKNMDFVSVILICIFILTIIFAARFYSVEVGRKALLHEIVIQSYEEMEAEEKENKDRQDKQKQSDKEFKQKELEDRKTTYERKKIQFPENLKK
ncbi:hypothetical protein MLD56_16375 [Paenibacillus peoriae]|uniref:hypothetical protein n=1 Tax=Paenibacillus peoriae TaxID=59893 RepID=UPI001F1455AD|nr:hypothetical protein [Paenibacillus peoriae]UMY53150.1 hypothetical protein MLD56_16375 [Paenibacillus peoriae]